MGAEAPGGRRGKLTAGARLRFGHPAVYARPCGVCEAHFWRADGTVLRDAAGEPVPRPPDSPIPTPCASCPKVPAWAKAAGKGWRELRALADDPSDQTRAAVEHYLRCRAVGAFSDDPVVRWAAGLIRAEEDAAADARADRRAAAVVEVVTLALRQSRR